MSAVSLSNLRPLALGTLVAGLLVAAPAANAKPIDPVNVKTSAAETTVTVAGDTKSDLKSSSGSSASVGDTKSDLASGSSNTYVTIERPQVVADDPADALPIVLSGLALLVAAGGAAYTVRRAPAPASH